MAEKKKEEQEGGKKSGGKMGLIIAAVLLLAAGIGAGAYYLGSKGALPGTGSAEAARAAGANSDIIGPMIEIEPFIVNILDNDGTRYLKAAITLEVETNAGRQEVIDRMPQLRDAILLVASNKTFDELRDLQGKLQLRAELLGRVNEIMRRDRVRRIYFTEFVVQ
ncbi:flagellar basal body-associated FliL family protein [Geoalkalibacter halelectricus]|uniref:Flagellar protein FliL n=1 Tax=Geoalkalibacter halelectricus TaxID=2847045 RepID=A0ABY5ZM96_9BACT|nr:flagellar basal body-associated protein FliL [Geoalkalibacter halelectricus]MDO3378068.1 flagellar basal body-associated FliL family protein [Geoalkalibacter halelectricus]UWZ78366.1 flagellar basal body-associated FliL family protein [Geoalkalibacter halelectricus]